MIQLEVNVNFKRNLISESCRWL